MEAFRYGQFRQEQPMIANEILQNQEFENCKVAIVARAVAIICFVLVVASSPLLAEEKRPTAPELFSQQTLLYLRIADTTDLKLKLSQTAIGKICRDPQVNPLIDHAYSNLVTATSEMQERVGVNLDEFLSIANGEFAVGIVSVQQSPVFCALIDCGKESPAVDLMMGQLEHRLTSLGGKKATIRIGNIVITKIDSGTEHKGVGYFFDSDKFVISSSPKYIETLARIWQGTGVDHFALANSKEFVLSLSHCVGSLGERPALSFYLNPIELYSTYFGQIDSNWFGAESIKRLGVNGVKGIYGSVILGLSDVDAILHTHLVTDNSRRGVLRAIQPKLGEIEPPAWVHERVSSYGAANWDFGKSIDALMETAKEMFPENKVISSGNMLGKLCSDLLGNRISWANGMVPKKPNESFVLSIQISNKKRLTNDFLPQVFRTLKAIDSTLRSKSMGATTMYYREIMKKESDVSSQQCVFGVANDELMLANSVEAFEMAYEMSISNDDPLAESIEYRLIRQRIKSQLRGRECSLIQYQNTIESLVSIYEMAKRTEYLSPRPGITGPLGSWLASFNGNQLPPFEIISKYLAPAGAFLSEEANDLHYTVFWLRRD